MVVVKEKEDDVLFFHFPIQTNERGKWWRVSIRDNRIVKSIHPGDLYQENFSVPRLYWCPNLIEAGSLEVIYLDKDSSSTKNESRQYRKQWKTGAVPDKNNFIYRTPVL